MSSFRTLLIACSLPLFLVACKTTENKEPPAPKMPVVINLTPYESEYAGKKIDQKLWIKVKHHSYWSARSKDYISCAWALYIKDDNLGFALKEGIKNISEKYYEDFEVLPDNIDLYEENEVPGDARIRIKSFSQTIGMRRDLPKWYSSDDYLDLFAGFDAQSNFAPESNTSTEWQFGAYTNERIDGKDLPSSIEKARKETHNYSVYCGLLKDWLSTNFQSAYDDAMRKFEAQFVENVINKQ